MKIKIKLSLTLLVSLLAIISIDIFLGGVYFEKYFRYMKARELKNIDFIINNQLDYHLLKKYQESKEAFVMVIKDDEVTTLNNFSYLVLSSKDEDDKILILDAILDNLYSSETFEIKKGDIIQVDAIQIKNNYYAPVKIEIDGKSYEDYKYINRNFSQENIVGEVKEFKNTHGIFSESDDFIEFLIENGIDNVNTGNYTDEDDEYMIVAKKIGNNTVIVFYAYENIRDIFPTIKSYFYFKGLIVLFLIVIIRKVLEKNIITPIEKVSDIATNIGKLNFEKRSYKKTNDEIEKLYEEIYQMSDNLENVIKLYKLELSENRNIKVSMEEKIKYFMHEIRTPLSAIVGFSDLLYETQKDENIKIINNEGKRLVKLISELIREEDIYNDERIKLMKFKLYPTIEMVLKIHENELKNLQVKAKCDKKIEVLADREKIEQVLFNLLNNSIQHSEKQIIIEVEEFQENIKISIENDGGNIQEENIKNVWNKYFTTNTNGAGIGLFVCKRIFELHNSDYNIENTNIGVKITFYLKKFLIKDIDEI